MKQRNTLKTITLHTFRLLLPLLAMLTTLTPAMAKDSGRIVIVSSYNPDTRRMSEHIEQFTAEYAKQGGKKMVSVENMNCRNLSESHLWKQRLWTLLKHYYEDGGRPDAIVLLGAEASSAYFSIDSEALKATPVFIAMRSNNIVLLPEDTLTDMKTWEPQAMYLDRDFKDYKISGGLVYDYDIQANFNLVRKLFPQCDSTYFISDNTLGGVTMRSHFIKELAKQKHFKAEFIDGRTSSFYDVNTTIQSVRGDKVVFIGTWRIDSSDSYFIGNTTASLGTINPMLPAISLANVGMGNWALGGFVPDYINSGTNLADIIIDYEKTGKAQPLTMIPNTYTFDYEKVGQFGFDEERLPAGFRYLNAPESMWDKYRLEITSLLIIFFMMAIALGIALHFLVINRRLQHELVQKNKRLEVEKNKAEEANEMKSAFIANVSHEIRTPLNAVMGFTQVLTNPDIPVSDEERREYGEYIQLNGQTLMNLINDILEISKMDAHKTTYNIEEADICQLAHNAAESLRSLLPRGVELITDIPDEVILVDTDVLRVQQVFSNLLSNARKFTTHGHIKIQIQRVKGGAGQSPQDAKAGQTPQSQSDAKAVNMVEISVSDTGTGIPADKAEAVFERFRQLDSFKQGTGLGLSITRSIVTELGGTIHVDTSYTSGARFVFTHPVK